MAELERSRKPGSQRMTRPSRDVLSNRWISVLGLVLGLVIAGVLVGCGSRVGDRDQVDAKPGRAVEGDGASRSEAGSGGRTEFTNSIEMRFVRIDAGRFQMGSDAGSGVQDDEKPHHMVALSYSFYMGAFEVRQRDFIEVMGSNPSAFSPGGQLADEIDGLETENLPVDSVSWDQADDFCRRLSARLKERSAGRFYRLPTEAEWEYCCRAGSRLAYDAGETLETGIAQFKGAGSSSRGPVRVGSFDSNGFGLHDMHGNVFEWCLDWFQQDYYRHSPDTDPRGPAKGTRRVIRGGGWNVPAEMCRSAFRDSKRVDASADYLGFRVVCIAGVFDGPGGAGSEATSPRPASVATGLPELVESVEPSVVRINARSDTGRGLGSGFLIFDNRTVITNYHVIERATTADVEFADGSRIPITGSVALLPDKDLAVLRLKEPRKGGRPLVLAEKLPRKGELTFALGAPEGLSFSMTDGKVSAVRNSDDMRKMGIDFGKDVTWIQSTTAISPGNSGGPLFNGRGEVIGVNTLVFVGSDGRGQALNFAVSAGDVEGLKDRIDGDAEPLQDRETGVDDQIQRIRDILGRIGGGRN